VVGTSVGFFVQVPPAAAHPVTLQYSSSPQSDGSEGLQPPGPASVVPGAPLVDPPPLLDVVEPLDVEVVPLEVAPLEDDELDPSPDDPKRSLSLEPPQAAIAAAPTKVQEPRSQALRTVASSKKSD
jgi:hypothetical protein